MTENVERDEGRLRLIPPGFDGTQKLKELLFEERKIVIEEVGINAYCPDPEDQKVVDYLMGITSIYIYPDKPKTQPISPSLSDTQPATDDSWIRKCGQLELHRF